MAMQQEPIDWRYLPYIRPMFQAHVTEYPWNMALHSPDDSGDLVTVELDRHKPDLGPAEQQVFPQTLAY